ncbi:MAG: membrane-associated phospholipid phosphatase [Granulosicoccus sp.]|jgi:membrane-associated phospholipid phosphatase
MVTYMLLMLLSVDPHLFGTNSVKGGMDNIMMIFASTFFIPIISVLMMKALKLIPSLELKDAQDRIGPFIVTGVFYISTYYLIYRNPNMPVAFKACFLGAVIGLFLAFLITLFSKISLHAVGVGGFLGMILITIQRSELFPFVCNTGVFGMVEVSLFGLLSTTILICGIVGTSRLILDAHEPKDLYGGYLVGLATQFIALSFFS